MLHEFITTHRDEIVGRCRALVEDFRTVGDVVVSRQCDLALIRRDRSRNKIPVPAIVVGERRVIPHCQGADVVLDDHITHIHRGKGPAKPRSADYGRISSAGLANRQVERLRVEAV